MTNTDAKIMRERVHFYPKGTPITFTSGCYSDFGIHGQLVTIEDCDLPALAKLYDREDREKKGENYYSANFDEFLGWLVAKGLAMPMAGEIVHLGEYGEWDAEFTS
jgi:hypothetical protein